MSTTALPELMDARKIATELGIPVDDAYSIMEKLPKIRPDWPPKLGGLRLVYALSVHRARIRSRPVSPHGYRARDARTLNPAARIGTNTQVVVAQVVARLSRQHSSLPVGCWEAGEAR